MKSAVSFALFVAIVSSAAANESRARPKCSTEKGLVTLQARKIEIRAALMAIADQSGLKIALDPSLRGHVAAALTCVKPKAALRELLGQLGAAFCEEAEVIRIYPVGRHRCDGVLTLPGRIERVSQER